MKILRDLIEKTHCLKIQGDLNTAVSDITADSREVKKGSLFICLCGAHVNGHDFAAKAAAQGAVAIVAQEPIDVPDEIAVVYVEDTREAMEDMAPFFFDYPSRKMRMIALTGTNGKTTTTHIAAHILHKAEAWSSLYPLLPGQRSCRFAQPPSSRFQASSPPPRAQRR